MRARVCGFPAQEVVDQFHGSVADFKIWDRQKQLVCYWPFDEKDGVEVKNHGSLKVNGELINTLLQPVRMPETSMFFNGRDCYINVGCLGDFGSRCAVAGRFSYTCGAHQTKKCLS